jgi:hypothetical protein
LCSMLLFLSQHWKWKFEIIKFTIIGMWKLALKTNWYKMCENWHFETWVKLVFANFWNLAQVFKGWK